VKPTTLPGISVTPSWLLDHLGGDVVIADVRWRPGGSVAEVFEREHLPGAISFDLDRDLARPAFDGPGRHPLPDPAAFAATMGGAGIGDDTPVVAYDDVGGWVAARLWWMLHVTDHPAALLDLPSLDAWSIAGGILEEGPADASSRTVFSERPWPADRLADAEQVRAALVADTAIVLDARAGERYRGEVEPIDPVAGHIPGSVSAPWQGNRGDDGPLLSPAVMRARYEALGVHDGGDAIASCGSGVTASFAVFAMELAGLPGAKLYDGSWSDWAHDPSRPVAIGAEPGRMPNEVLDPD
jgi:thiosulfate/3-mercaptopyruvate sulfurtransferase